MSPRTKPVLDANFDVVSVMLYRKDVSYISPAYWREIC